jgi:trigger factor
MKVEVQEVGACKRRLHVEEEPEVVQQAWERAMAQVQREARLPGFRKGKVPRSMIKLHFGDDVRQEVARHLIPEVYRQAVAESRLRPVEEPDLEGVTLEENAPLKFSALVEIKPTIELGSYTDLEVKHSPRPLEESEVEAALNQLREQHAEYRVVERSADLNDLVLVDYTVTPEGMTPRSEEGALFVVGNGSVVPQIEEAVIGLVPGATRQAHFRFPDTHRNEDLRGRAAEATVTVKEVKEKALPPLDDDFAKTLGEFDSLEGLRTAVRERLQAQRERENRRALEEAVVDALLTTHTFPVGETLVRRQAAHTIEHGRQRLRRQGVDPDKLHIDYTKMLDEVRPGAERAVRRSLLLEAIAEKEGLDPTEAEVDAEVERIAQASQRPAPAVRRLMEQSDELDALRFSLRESRVLAFVLERTRIAEDEAR